MRDVMGQDVSLNLMEIWRNILIQVVSVKGHKVSDQADRWYKASKNKLFLSSEYVELCGKLRCYEDLAISKVKKEVAFF